MSGIKASEALGEAFRDRGKNGVLFRMFLLFAAAYLVLSIVFIALAWPYYAAYFTAIGQAVTAGDSQGASQALQFAGMSHYGSLGLGMLIMYPGLIALWSMFESAVMRWLVRGESGQGLWGFVLDRDCGRTAVILLTWVGLWLGLYLVLILGAVFIGLTIAAVANSAPAVVTVAISILLVLALLAALIYIPARFAPASALSIARRRYSFAQAWSLTKGAGGKLFGAYAMATIAYVFAIIVFYVLIIFVIAMVVFQEAGAGADLSQVDYAKVFSNPILWTFLGLSYAGFLAIYFVIMAVYFGIGAHPVIVALREGRLILAEKEPVWAPPNKSAGWGGN